MRFHEAMAWNYKTGRAYIMRVYAKAKCRELGMECTPDVTPQHSTYYLTLYFKNNTGLHCEIEAPIWESTISDSRIVCQCIDDLIRRNPQFFTEGL